jgi:hypothetical protein
MFGTIGSVDSALLPCQLPCQLPCLLSLVEELWRLQKSGLDVVDRLPLLLNWLERQPPWKRSLLRPKFPKDWR